jgi:hypothetical protein
VYVYVLFPVTAKGTAVIDGMIRIELPNSDERPSAAKSIPK